VSELIDKAQKALQTFRDDKLPPWQQVTQALSALNGLPISDLKPDHKQKLESYLLEVNQITHHYNLEQEEDYQRLSQDELAKIRELIESASQECLNSETSRILAELSVRRKLPRQAVEEIRRYRELFTPILLEVMETAVDRVSQGLSAEDYDALMAFCMLAEFKEPRLYGTLLKLLRLPDDGAFDLLGDAIHEFVAPVIAGLVRDRATGEISNTVGGASGFASFDTPQNSTPERVVVPAEKVGTDEVVEIIRDTNLNLYVRWALAGVFKYLARDEVISVESAIDSLHAIMADALKRIEEQGQHDGDWEFLAGVAIELADLAAEKSLPLIRSAYQRKLVDESVIDLESIEGDIGNGEARVAATFGECRPTGLPDVLDELKHWYAFQEPSPRPSPRPALIPKPNFTNPPPNRAATATATHVRGQRKIGRNELCPCGSGKKYKKCCL